MTPRVGQISRVSRQGRSIKSAALWRRLLPDILLYEGESDGFKATVFPAANAFLSKCDLSRLIRSATSQTGHVQKEQKENPLLKDFVRPRILKLITTERGEERRAAQFYEGSMKQVLSQFYEADCQGSRFVRYAVFSA